jgi:uncharacterized membrane protein YfcA
MISFYEQYRSFIDVLANIATFSLFLFFFILFRKTKSHKDYWKGFLLMFIGSMLVWTNLVVSLPAPVDTVRRIIKTLLIIIGAYLIFRGGKSTTTAREENKRVSS